MERLSLAPFAALLAFLSLLTSSVSGEKVFGGDLGHRVRALILSERRLLT
jgi:hypothetical protein